ncbi:maleylpyruvate isomerase N-terminal domain-containing protein [Sanguibacter suaedae]|uniref:Maleylpyruvate isomerase N-terminal domain-containing protein n=1 Tax=Sanguibacter suaedae TaxID=2795737 RepID=A0A934IDW9_9MICO|nr:maleylpyruvate isomerase N-terminal domain-containing protein [Sanguibacter suaedae]MBI9116213.1 maleylpyruvate isomerase N-terminal domain-containing protein [Sanguibacter suaedae]
MTADLAQISTALHTQWTRTRSWLEPLGDDLLGARDRPSVLDGWTTGELVAHLARAMDALAVCEPAPAGTVPMTLAEYLGTSPGRVDEIASTTRDLASEISASPHAEVERRAAAALRRLTELGDDGALVVQAPRGPVSLRDMTTSRLVELVVHTLDLTASLEGVAASTGPSDPIDRGALTLVAEELLDIVVRRGGWSIELVDARRWVRLAAGRTRYDVDELAAAISPRYTAGGVPDLGRLLPLL